MEEEAEVEMPSPPAGIDRRWAPSRHVATPDPTMARPPSIETTYSQMTLNHDRLKIIIFSYYWLLQRLSL